MKRIAVFLSALLILPLLALAADDQAQQDQGQAGREVKVRKLIELSGGTRMVTQMKESIKKMTAATAKHAFEGEKQDEETQKITQKYTQKMMDNILSDEKINEIINMMVPIYAKYLSEKEIDDIIAFYESPSGKKMTDSMPKIMGEYMGKLGAMQKSWMDSIKQDSEDMKTELKTLSDKRNADKSKEKDEEDNNK